MSRSVRLFIQDMLECAQKVVRYAHGMSRAAFGVQRRMRGVCGFYSGILRHRMKRLPIPDLAPEEEAQLKQLVEAFLAQRGARAAKRPTLGWWGARRRCGSSIPR